MLKSAIFQSQGRNGFATLTELPALVADRYARTALAAVGAPVSGGIVTLALEHVQSVLQLGEPAIELLQPFVQTDKPIHGWRNVLAAQQAALALHVGFLIGRPRLEIPVSMHARAIETGAGELAVHFCSPSIATVLHSGRASYRELETVLSTEDVFNLVELINVERILDWRAHQSAGNPQ